MKIVACYKCIKADPIGTNKDGTLDFSKSTLEIGKYDLAAVEAAMKVAAVADAKVTALTANGAVVSDTKMKKTILSRGPAEMVGVQDACLEDADSLTVAEVLKNAVEKMDDVGLVICGEGSGDMYARQVGSLMGAMLGWPTVNEVSAVEYLGDNTVKVERTLSDCTEVLTVALPAVLGVTSDIYSPRIPSMKDIIGAGKKPSTVWSLADVGYEYNAAASVVSVLAPEKAERKQIILEGASEENLDALAEYIKKAL